MDYNELVELIGDAEAKKLAQMTIGGVVDYLCCRRNEGTISETVADKIFVDLVQKMSKITEWDVGKNLRHNVGYVGELSIVHSCHNCRSGIGDGSEVSKLPNKCSTWIRKEDQS